MIYSETSGFSYSFATPLTKANGVEKVVLLDVEEVLREIIPGYAEIVTFNAHLKYLRANYHLGGLRRLPLPDISGLESESVERGKIISHKETYNPLTGHAVEITFYRRRKNGIDDWMPLFRDYFYNVGDFEQYIDLINPYLGTQEVLPLLGKNDQLSIRFSQAMENLADDDYFTIHGGISGECTYLSIPEFSGKIVNSEFTGQAIDGQYIYRQGKRRNYLLIINNGPGNLFWSFADNEESVVAHQSLLLEPSTSVLFERGGNSYTGISNNLHSISQILIPQNGIFFSSDSVANFLLSESFLDS